MIVPLCTGCDCPEKLQVHFQDPASNALVTIISFNQHLMLLIIFIVILVGWILLNCLIFYSEFKNNENSKFSESKEIEIFWTVVPILVIFALLSPSIMLIYELNEAVNYKLTLKILGHQWFWNYHISDYDLCLKKNQTIKYNCYLMVTDGLPFTKIGYLRLLETNKRILLPTDTNIRLLISAADVLHSWSIPSLGIKLDACPGRLNQTNLFVKRVGLFFGQCSEICGVNHGFMPIALVSLPIKQFYFFTVLNKT